jgi:exopolysaccharide biosynthesis protein
VGGNTMLLEDGIPVLHTNKLRHPRTAAGLDAKGTRLVLLVVDGRKPGVAIGMTYDELARELLRFGCTRALNLDGGGSSVMALRDEVPNTFRLLNEPTDGHERAVANALGIAVKGTR